MALIAGFLAGLLGTMIDPLVIGAGVASYFIGKSWNNWAITAMSVFVFATFLFALVAVLAGPNFHVGQERFLFLLAAVAAWAAISYAVSLARKRFQGAG